MEKIKSKNPDKERAAVVAPKSIKILITVFSVFIIGVGALAFLSLRSNKSSSGYSNGGSNGDQSASLAGGQYPTTNSGGGGCGGGSGGGCGGGASGSGGGCGSSGPSKTPDQLNSIKAEGVKYYVQKYGDSSVTAEVNDKGCHVEVVILKEKQPVKYLSFKNGQFSELS
jgi:hypothetical protein